MQYNTFHDPQAKLNQTKKQKLYGNLTEIVPSVA